ncbi:hypothetical protein [Dactylosporangium matsuzakiense]|uniref:Uncharacterized protein n=1 Tax=Dactylosporangium matsuzakiense TaxID=53360 RepID=A0A9W6NPI4_9ACTN|nr:hypothetical protein [Dactylosporangium matsuzakiense]UWZ45481.1 hypothetical protein Dmats_02785 [Dactylosporangium matsuzakiense]GLL04363.1 hypothetical protein GCM10017581_061100 [Dactylosporangium matsuzakiense]
MARLRARIERAAAQHRHTAALIAAAGPILEKYSPNAAPSEQYAEQHDLAAGLRANAAMLAPGWLGAQLDAMAPTTPLGGPLPPTFVRVGQAHPLDDARFPVIVPLLRAGHIAVDADARDPRVAGLLRSLVLRLLASSPPGSVRIRAIDAVVDGPTFGWFTGIDAIMPAPATDIAGLRGVLDEGERWLATRGDGPAPTPTLLLVIASLPELTEGRDLARIAQLAHAGPAGRLHLIAAGWPPPPLTQETTQAPLPHATQIAIRNPHAWVGDPPGATFSGTGTGPSRLNAPVYLDPDPPVELVRRVCAQLSGPWTAPPAPVGEASRTAWLEYVGAGQRLDAVRREVIAVVAEHKTALKAAQQDLTAIRAKLAHHEAYLTEVAGEAGGRPLELRPAWPEIQAAHAALTGAGQPLDPRRGAPMAPPPPPSPALMGASGAWPQGQRILTTPVSAPPRPPLSVPPVSGGPASAMPGTPAVAGAPRGPVTGGYPVVAPRSVPPTQHTGPISGVPVSGPGGIVGTGVVRPLNMPVPESIPGRVATALRMAAAGLKRSEAELAAPGRQAASNRRVWVNAGVYFAFALLAAIVQIPALLASERLTGAGLLALPCALVLPAVSFGLGWLTIGAMTRQTTSRTPALGMVISLLALVPVLVFGGVILFL